MNLMHEDLARAHCRELQRQASDLQRGREMALALKLARRAERTANQARLHLARAMS